MNFEQFQLPGHLLCDLYKESLVELNEIQQNPDKKPDIKEKILGNNQKKVLILVNDDESEVISEPDLSFLLTILKACKLTLNDVVILNFNTQKDLTLHKMVQEFNPKVMLLFGVKQTSINMPVLFPEFQIQSYKEIRFLSSPTLEVLKKEEEIKRKLWNCLKQLFLS